VLKVTSDPGVIGTYNSGRLDSRSKCLRPESEWIPMAVERIVDDEIFKWSKSCGCGATQAGIPARPVRTRREPSRNA